MRLPGFDGQFLRVGDQILNLNHVTRIDLRGDSHVVFELSHGRQHQVVEVDQRELRNALEVVFASSAASSTMT